MPLFYILADDGKTPVATQDMLLVAKQRMTQNWIVAKSKSKDEKVTVSTVFLSLDHGWGEGAPVLFETLVFGGQHDGRMNRYTSWDDAERGHKVMCGVVGVAWSNLEDKGSMTA